MVNKELITGTYEHLYTKELADTYEKIGFPKEVVGPLVGSVWTSKVGFCGEKFFWHVTCPEHPAMNVMTLFDLGVESTYTMGGFAGTGLEKTVFTMTPVPGKDNQMTVKRCMGGFTSEELWTYSEEGICGELTFKGSPIKVTEFHKRVVQVNGSYIVEKEENVETVFKMFPEWKGTSFIGAVCTIKMEGDHMCWKEKMQGQEFTQSSKLGEETKSPYFAGVTQITTKVANNKFKTVQKRGNQAQDWTIQVADCGICATCTDVITGKVAKLWYRRFVDITGEYKMVSIHGADDLLMAWGVPSKEMAKEMALDAHGKKVKVCHDTGVYRMVFEGFKNFPTMDYSFKLGEEVTFVEPIGKTECKCIATMCGNVMQTVTTVKGMVMKGKSTFTDNFLVMETCMEGTDVMEKVIAIKVC